jgi:CNT family concentrative nucleoside transporter
MERLISVVGVFVILGVGVALSTDRRRIQPRVVAWGLGIQTALALFILRTPVGKVVFEKLGEFVTRVLDFSKLGAGFVFGPMASIEKSGFIFAFQVLPTIIFVGSLMAVAYYYGVMQRIVAAVAWLMVRTMGTSGAESLSAVACVFVGQSEAPLVIQKYIPTMTKSELNAAMTGGMATIAGSVMAAYIGMGVDASHLLAASIMGAPAGLVMAKLIVPETEVPQTAGGATLEVSTKDANVVEAAARGAIEGMHLAGIVAAMLVSFIALVAFVNAAIGAFGFGVDTLLYWVSDPGRTWLAILDLTLLQVLPPETAQRFSGLNLEVLLGYAFAPLALVMGVPLEDVLVFGGLLGKKIVLNEFVAYSDLTAIIKGESAQHLTPRGATMATYALCGFANLSSIAINIGCIGGIAPERRGELAALGLRAMAGGALASCLTATIAGILG